MDGLSRSRIKETGDIDTLRKCVYLVGSGTGGRWVLVVTLAVVVGVLEVVGGLLVFVLLGLITGASEALVLPVVGDLHRWIPGVPERDLFLWAAALIAGFFLFRAVVVVGQGYLEHRVAENAGVRIADGLVRGYLHMPYEFHAHRNSAELLRNAFDTVQHLVFLVFVPGVQLIAQTMIVLGLFLVLLLIAPQATVLAVGLLVPLLYILFRILHPRLKDLGRVGQMRIKESLQALQESLQGVRDIKVLGRETFFATSFTRNRAALARTRYLRGTLATVPYVATETVLVLAIVGIFALAVLTGETGTVLPVLGLFGYVGLRLKPTLTAIISSLNTLRFAGAAIDEVYADLRMCETLLDTVPPEVVQPLPLRRDLVLADVSFRYEGTSEDVLRDVRLTIPRGASVGVVGPTGGGKTTLVDLIIGLLQPTSGSVLVDGTDIRQHLRAWQANIGMVPQVVFLIDDTLRRNIALGVDDADIDDDALAEVIGLAQLEDLVDALPAGLDTVVGERGVRLSGGQRQRVAIARALYRGPSVLVFDEGTSALDTHTEALLIGSLDQLRGGRTLITVAHRLSTVRAADFLVLVSGGRVTGVGSFDDLLEHSAEFRQLAR